MQGQSIAKLAAILFSFPPVRSYVRQLSNSFVLDSCFQFLVDLVTSNCYVLFFLQFLHVCMSVVKVHRSSTIPKKQSVFGATYN